MFFNRLLQWNLPQMFVLLIEFHAMIQVSISLQTHRTMVAYFVPAISVCFGGTLVATHGTLRFFGTPVEKH